MGTTPVFKIPYPEPTDRVTDYPVTGQSLANKVEGLLVALPLVTNIVTAQTGWRVDASNCRALGKLAFFNANLTRTGAAITASTTTDVANVAVATVNPAGFGNGSTAFIFAGPISAGSFGRLASYTMNNAGIVSLTSMGGSADLATNGVLSFVGVALMN